MDCPWPADPRWGYLHSRAVAKNRLVCNGWKYIYIWFWNGIFLIMGVLKHHSEAMIFCWVKFFCAVALWHNCETSKTWLWFPVWRWRQMLVISEEPTHVNKVCLEPPSIFTSIGLATYEGGGSAAVTAASQTAQKQPYAVQSFRNLQEKAGRFCAYLPSCCNAYVQWYAFKNQMFQWDGKTEPFN